MTDKTITNCRPVGGDYFRLIYLRKSNKTLNYYLDKFDFSDYWCFKCTNIQKLINYEEFLEFKYASYTFFKKDLYDVNKILEWVEWSKITFNGNGLQYLVKPTPPFNPNKIIIRK